MDPRVLPLALALLVVVPAVAGCLGGTDPSPASDDVAPSNETEDPDQPGRLVRSAEAGPPDWSVGQWFEYDRSGRWTEPGTSRLVVVEATSDGYVTGLTNRSQARIDVYWSNDPLLGELGAGLGPPTYEASPAAPTVLDFPLTDGRSWSTEGWGGSWTFNATRVEEVETPDGTAPGYRIRGGSSNNYTIEATYVPSLGAVTSFTGASPDEVVYAYVLTDLGTGYEGSAWTASRSVAIDNRVYSSEDLVPPAVEFSVPSEATDVVATVIQFSATASATSLVDPVGNVRHQAATTPVDPAVETRVTVRDPAAGTWRWVMQAAGSSTDPASCGSSPPQAALCGGIFLRTASMTLSEAELG